MTWEQYWHGDPLMVLPFRKADRLRQKRRDAEAWQQGAYIYDAVGRLAPVLHAFAKKGAKPIPYLKEPYTASLDAEAEEEITEEQRQIEEKKEIQKAQIHMLQMRLMSSKQKR